MSLLLRNIRLATSETPVSLFIDRGQIHFEEKSADETIDGSVLLALPGLIDCHVHFREPGYEHKGTIKSESLAAFHGGVTLVCEMPNTNPPTTTIEALKQKIALTKDAQIDLRFFFGITERKHLEEVKKLFSDPKHSELKKRCAGIKIYFEHSTGNQKIDVKLLPDVFQTCKELSIPLVGHCEDSGVISHAARRIAQGIAAHSVLRPPEAEAAAIMHAIELSKPHKTPFHIAHLSTKQGAELVRQAKHDGLPITCEVAPHHLFLTADDYASLGPLAKMNPPLRTGDHLEALWAAITDHTIDCIATDHAPHTFKEKHPKDPLQAPSGVPGVETMLPLLLSVANGHWPHPHSKNPGATLQFSDILRLCFENPKEIFHLEKQHIENGGEADLVLIDNSLQTEILAKNLHSLCGWTPFEGWKTQGKILRVIRGTSQVQTA